MTSATDELRRLLDERGADYRVSATGYSIDVGPYTTAYANRSDTTLDVSLRQVTPEQAIAATLGTETCKVDVLNTGDCAGYECSEYIMHCNGCGHEFGHVLYNEDGDVWMSEPPNYCPNCGKRIEVDE